MIGSAHFDVQHGSASSLLLAPSRGCRLTDTKLQYRGKMLVQCDMQRMRRPLSLGNSPGSHSRAAGKAT
eukprot:6979579-Pyramimonas_sp.AAC.1